MPLEKCESTRNRNFGIWLISEDESELTQLLSEEVPKDIKHHYTRLQWLSSRLLVKTLLEQMQYTYYGIDRDQSGKPTLKQNSFRISIAHAFPYVVAIIDKHKAVGIDVIRPSEQLLEKAEERLTPGELDDAGESIVKCCIYLCAKEALLKYHGNKKELDVQKNLVIEPFQFPPTKIINGRLILGRIGITVSLEFSAFNDLIILSTA